MDFLSVILLKDLARMYLLCIDVASSGQGKVLLHEDHMAMWQGRLLCLMYGCSTSYCIYSKNLSCSWHHSDTTTTYTWCYGLVSNCYDSKNTLVFILCTLTTNLYFRSGDLTCAVIHAYHPRWCFSTG